MSNNGWSFSSHTWSHNSRPKCNAYAPNSYHGFVNGYDGEITATFTGKGTATLDYGNCGAGKVYVFLDGGIKDTASGDAISKKITFDFTAGTVLKISEEQSGGNQAIIKLSSLQFTCLGGR